MDTFDSRFSPSRPPLPRPMTSRAADMAAVVGMIYVTLALLAESCVRGLSSAGPQRRSPATSVPFFPEIVFGLIFFLPGVLFLVFAPFLRRRRFFAAVILVSGAAVHLLGMAYVLGFNLFKILRRPLEEMEWPIYFALFFYFVLLMTDLFLTLRIARSFRVIREHVREQMGPVGFTPLVAEPVSSPAQPTSVLDDGDV